MEIYSHFLYTWKTKKKKFLIDAHTKTGVRIYWHARFRQKLVIFLQGVNGEANTGTNKGVHCLHLNLRSRHHR